MKVIDNVSILIPTHNRSHLLVQTLESLRHVAIPSALDVEIIVIANACTDNTEEVAAERAGTLPVPLRCVAEPEPGLNAARNRAMREARGEILAYLDDDVWVEPDWLSGLVRTFGEFPADIVGGKVVLWWQAIEPPEWVTPAVVNALSANEHGEVVREYQHGALMAIGANVAFRRRVFDLTGPFRHGLDRTGELLLSGGETDLIRRALPHGCRLFYSPLMVVRHWVDPQRATKRHLRLRAIGAGMSSAYARPPLTPQAAASLLAGNSARMAAHAILDGMAFVAQKPGKSVNHRMMWNYYLGGLVGLWKRARGHSPVKRG